jgi:Cu2+-exporting ATPase
MDVSIRFPVDGRIDVRSEYLFGDLSQPKARAFVERAMRVPAIERVTIRGKAYDGCGISKAEIHFDAGVASRDNVVKSLIAELSKPDEMPEEMAVRNSGKATNLVRSVGGDSYEQPSTSTIVASEHESDSESYVDAPDFAPETKAAESRFSSVRFDSTERKTARPEWLDRLWPHEFASNEPKGPDSPQEGKPRANQHILSFNKNGELVTAWEILMDSPGKMKLRNTALYRRKEVCQVIERELMSVLGVDSYKTSPLTSSLSLTYDPRQIRREQVLELLDHAIVAAEVPVKLDKFDLQLPIATGGVVLAALGQFVYPVLLPVGAVLLAYCAITTFKEAYKTIFEEKRLGVDVLDSIVVVGCLATSSIFAGAVLCWCLELGRLLVRKTQDDSKKLLMTAFGKQPRFVWLLRDGVEVQVAVDKLRPGDIVVVNTGETVPVDGFVQTGMAMIDQHALTGESTPAEKSVGDRVFASTVMVAGKIEIRVENSGSETASAKIGKILNDTAGYKLTSQNKGEQLADKAVIPTLALGGTALATMGPAGAIAVLNSDFGTGIRMAAPLALLSSLALAAQKGILIKDGRALEQLNEVDTFLFDKTGTLTRERPEVGRIFAANGYDQNQVMAWAAAAEYRFSHPIAKAILHKFEEMNLELPVVDDSHYAVGFGIKVRIDGRTMRVGSPRYMTMEGIEIPAEIREAQDAAHDEGNTMVMVADDDRLAGAIELQAAIRPEVIDIIAGLRQRGIKHIAIISGDHEAPTKRLAEALGMDRYFAQVLPQDKADYVERLQNEGRKVCFVGDGINDSIALKKANVSISLRGASTIATDTAHIVFMEEGLSKLLDLRDIARNLDRNIKRSWTMIIIPNAMTIVGAFTLGFGVMVSVFMNNVTAVAALANGMAPLRQLKKVRAEQELEREMRLIHGFERKIV